MPILVIKILIALIVDQWLGEPKRHHPLIAFGQLADQIEKRVYRPSRSRGLLAWSLAVLPLAYLTWMISTSLNSWALGLWEIAIVYLAVGRKSLFEHSQRVYHALSQNNLELARQATAMMVSRDCNTLNAEGCTSATVESVLENGNDSLFGVLFWFAILGAPGVVLYRLSNTLDAMWGYKTNQYREFGWAAARIDDVLNYIPARICALCYALAGQAHKGITCWQDQSHLLSSPNGGPVMCAGAGALGVTLGGPAVYQGKRMEKPYFGQGAPATAEHIIQANRLVDRGLLAFLLALTVGSWLW